MQKSKINKSDNKPPNAVRKFIRKSNIVSFETELNFNSSEGLDKSGEILNRYLKDNYLFFLEWANIHHLKRYPKLFRYLSYIAKKNQSWESAFDRIKKIRKFMNIFVEIAELYQKQLKTVENGLSFFREHKTDNQTHSELIFVLENWRKNKSFQLSYLPPGTPIGLSNLLKRNLDPYKKQKEDLEKRLFGSAFSFFSLTANEDHLSVISFDGFLEVLNNVDLRRLKRCLLCLNIFWAYRLNAKFCSRKCSNHHHQKVLRADEVRKNEVNKARRNNYRLKKKSEKRKNNNGTL